jgi:hypothetical protein
MRLPVYLFKIVKQVTEGTTQEQKSAYGDDTDDN